MESLEPRFRRVAALDLGKRGAEHRHAPSRFQMILRSLPRRVSVGSVLSEQSAPHRGVLLAIFLLLASSVVAAERMSHTAALHLIESLSTAQRGAIQRPFSAALPPTLLAPSMTQEAIEAKNRYRPSLGDSYVSAYLRTQAAGGGIHAGLSIQSLNEKQRDAVFGLLQCVFSPNGLKKIGNVMKAAWQSENAGSPTEIHPSITLTIFGAPSPTEPWILQITGDHLLFVIRFTGDEAVVLRSFTGARRVAFESEGGKVRILGVEIDKACALMAALDERQREQVAMKVGVGDLTLWPDDSFPLPPSDRLKASGMSLKQREMLLDLIGEWARVLNTAYTLKYLERVKETVPDTWLVWAGPSSAMSDGRGGAYFRIHGPHVFIEFAPQSLRGEGDTHVHAIYRSL